MDGTSGVFRLGAEDSGIASWHPSPPTLLADFGLCVQNFIAFEMLRILQTFIIFWGI